MHTCLPSSRCHIVHISPILCVLICREPEISSCLAPSRLQSYDGGSTDTSRLFVSPLFFFPLPLPLYHQSIRYTRMCKAARPKKSNTSRQTPNTPTFPLPFLLFPVINRPEVSDTQPFPSELSLPTVSPGTRTYPHFYFISSIYSFRAFPFRNFLPDV